MGNEFRISANAMARHPVNTPADTPNRISSGVPHNSFHSNKENRFPKVPPNKITVSIN